MFDSIHQLDVALFLWLNHLNAAWLDPVMVFLSARWVWVPGYVLLLWLCWRRLRLLGTLKLLVVTALLIIVTDSGTTRLMKQQGLRLRPCHHPDTAAQVRQPPGVGCGGKYGLASSHASNSFGLAALLGLFFWYRRGRAISIVLGVWAVLVSYSRIYLGVHFPGDILAGAAIGILAGAGLYWVFGLWLREKPDTASA